MPALNRHSVPPISLASVSRFLAVAWMACASASGDGRVFAVEPRKNDGALRAQLRLLAQLLEDDDFRTREHAQKLLTEQATALRDAYLAEAIRRTKAKRFDEVQRAFSVKAYKPLLDALATAEAASNIDELRTRAAAIRKQCTQSLGYAVLLAATKGNAAPPPSMPQGQAGKATAEPGKRVGDKADEKARPRHAVRTTRGLLEAIGSNRVIELLPGEYDLGKVRDYQGKHASMVKVHDGGHQLNVRHVSNLTIICRGKTPAHVVTPDRFAEVISFVDCKGVELVNLKLGHRTQEVCMGGVLEMKQCENVTLTRCDLYGCGAMGIHAEGVDGLTLYETIIRDCTNWIMELRHCRDVSVRRCWFARNAQYGGVRFHNTRPVLIEDCLFEDNAAREALLEPLAGSEATVKHCVLVGNASGWLARPVRHGVVLQHNLELPDANDDAREETDAADR